MRASHDYWFGFYSLLVEKLARFFLPVTTRSNALKSESISFDFQLKTGNSTPSDLILKSLSVQPKLPILQIARLTFLDLVKKIVRGLLSDDIQLASPSGVFYCGCSWVVSSVSQLEWSVILWVQLGDNQLASSGGVSYCGSGIVSYCGCSWVVFCLPARVECLTVLPWIQLVADMWLID